MSKKFRCSICGNIVEIDPTLQVLSCPQCGKKYRNAYFNPNSMMMGQMGQMYFPGGMQPYATPSTNQNPYLPYGPAAVGAVGRIAPVQQAPVAPIAASEQQRASIVEDKSNVKLTISKEDMEKGLDVLGSGYNPEVQENPDPDAMLVVRKLVKTYPKSDRVAVNNISFFVKPGEIFGFLGQNGAGKSTTIKCLTGILPFDSGEIRICGHDIVKEPIQAKMHMGYVPDNHSVYEKLTGREYVNYVADLYKVPSDVRHERLEHFAKLFKLEHAMNRQIKSYSHGMKQKICIIAALIHDPKLWVLDEPMMGLDPQSTAEIIAHMRRHCANGNTVFFSSHNLDLVKKLCHRVAIINDGKIIDMFDLAGNEQNKAHLEERFFRLTGTYDDELFEDYIAQESEDMRPTAAPKKKSKR